MMSQKIKLFSHSSVVLKVQSQQAASTLSSPRPTRPAESETQEAPSALTSPPGGAHTSGSLGTVVFLQLSGPGSSAAEEEKAWKNASQLWSHPQLPRKAQAWPPPSLEARVSLTLPLPGLGPVRPGVLTHSVLGQVWSARPCPGGNILDLTIGGW